MIKPNVNFREDLLEAFFGVIAYIYDKENKSRYTLDVMRLYAPVTGVELTCAPKVFIDEQIKQNFTQALAANINVLKLKSVIVEQVVINSSTE
jgi:hypothetical protein